MCSSKMRQKCKEHFEIIGKVFRESAMDSTSHGLPHVFKRDTLFIQLFWIICFTASAGVCFFMISQTITDYLKYETVSKTETILEIPSKFPTISICNLNGFQTNDSAYFLSKIPNANYLLNLNFFQYNYLPEFYNSFQTFKYLLGTNAANTAVSDKTRKALGLQLDDMLISCSFNLNSCTVDDFEWYFSEFYGNCYRFNSGKNSTGGLVDDVISTKAGSFNGLSMELYVGDPENTNTFAISNGARIFVHNKVF